MIHADPWGETARLERQMHSELLGQREDPPPGVLTRPESQSRSSRGHAAFTPLLAFDVGASWAKVELTGTTRPRSKQNMGARRSKRTSASLGPF